MNKIVITPLQMVLLILLDRSATAILLLPVVTGANAKQDVWIASFVNIFLGLFIAWLMLKLASKYPRETVIEYAPKILGKWLGSLAALGIIFFYYFIFTLTVRQFSEFVVNSSMPETPIEVFMMALALAIFYGVRTGLENIARANAFVTIIIYINLFISLSLVLPEMKFGNLLPVLDNPWSEIIKAGTTSASWFGEMVVLLMLYPNINKPEKLKWPLYGSVVFTSLMVTLIAVSVISVVGPVEAAKQTYPFYSIVKMISLGEIIERIESISMAIWTASVYLKGCLFLYCAIQGLTQLSGFKDSKPIASPLTLLGIMISIFMFHNFAELRNFQKFNSWVPFMLSSTVLIPIVLLLISFFRGTKPREET